MTMLNKNKLAIIAAALLSIASSVMAAQVQSAGAAYAHGHGRYGDDGAYYGYGRYHPYNGSFYKGGRPDPQVYGPTVGDR
jgi:hypothetical protein